MKLLIDEMLSPVIARELRSRGPDVTAIKGSSGHESLTDPELMDLARRQRRAVVTNNLRDYRPLHHAAITTAGPGHHGMVFMPSGYRRTKSDTGRIVSALEAVLLRYPGEDDLANAEAWI